MEIKNKIQEITDTKKMYATNNTFIIAELQYIECQCNSCFDKKNRITTPHFDFDVSRFFRKNRNGISEPIDDCVELKKLLKRYELVILEHISKNELQNSSI